MPLILSKTGDAEKTEYLAELFDQTYIRDIIEREIKHKERTFWIPLPIFLPRQSVLWQIHKRYMTRLKAKERRSSQAIRLTPIFHNRGYNVAWESRSPEDDFPEIIIAKTRFKCHRVEWPILVCDSFFLRFLKFWGKIKKAWVTVCAFFMRLTLLLNMRVSFFERLWEWSFLIWECACFERRERTG